MKMQGFFSKQKTTIILLTLLFIIGVSTSIQAQVNYKQYKGTIIDSQTEKPLVFASLLVRGTNISTISNTDGKFLLKIPDNIANAEIIVSFIGYHQKIVPLSEFKKRKTLIMLIASVTKLSEISISLPTDAKALVRQTLKKKGDNNLNKHSIMTAFYRETIKKRKKNVSLAEAIVNVYKQPYTSLKKDYVKLYKARKSTDYTKLDTLALKLQGGPYNALYIDLMKYPEFMFTDDVIDLYTFSFGPSTTINEKPVFVVNFKQRGEVIEPLYYGKLFIDSKTLALTSAAYSLNVENKELTSKLFVKKKPKDVFVYPTEAAYRVDYREKDGRWYYGYSNVQLTFKIKRKGKLFNSVYSLISEMAITDWKLNTENEKVKFRERLRPTIIIADEASGFSDPEFWGAYNVIEPEKSIESAIDKIKRQLKKINKS
jgi:hypothetical protein